MLLAIDIGNTNIVLGLYLDGVLSKKFRLESSLDKSSEDYAIDIVELFLNEKIDCLKIFDVIIASVVPKLTPIVADAIKKLHNGTPLIVGNNDAKLKIKICLNDPKEVGQDRLINSIAAYDKFGGNLIVVDFGTATTFDVVGSQGEYFGGVISPGVNLSIKALYDMTAQLPRITLKSQKNIIGKSTIEAINSGIYFGYISLVEGMIKKIKAEYQQEMKVITTGGLSSLFGKVTKDIDHIEPDLTLEGLRLAHQNLQRSGEDK
jgi:type III pantothenate kinase